MMRPAILFWLLAVGITSAFVFGTGRQVDSLEAELNRLDRAIVAESEAIRVLQADWSYLNHPDRLRTLVRDHTSLGPASAGQIVPAATQIPHPLPQPGEMLAVAETRLPGFEQLPLPSRHPAAGPPPAFSPADGQSPDSDAIGALLISLNGVAGSGSAEGATP